MFQKLPGSRKTNIILQQAEGELIKDRPWSSAAVDD